MARLANTIVDNLYKHLVTAELVETGKITSDKGN
jgi:hypothetical protein